MLKIRKLIVTIITQTAFANLTCYKQNFLAVMNTASKENIFTAHIKEVSEIVFNNLLPLKLTNR